jgi:hypothetical protein
MTLQELPLVVLQSQEKIRLFQKRITATIWAKTPTKSNKLAYN